MLIVALVLSSVVKAPVLGELAPIVVLSMVPPLISMFGIIPNPVTVAPEKSTLLLANNVVKLPVLGILLPMAVLFMLPPAIPAFDTVN